MNAKLPEWTERFFAPARYKCAHGGRGSSKTWSFARMIAIKGAEKPLIIRCCREFQKNLAESAKPAIEQGIRDMGLSDEYIIQEKVIKGKNGTIMHFHGLERNRASIKGWEGTDICWTEEAERLSHESAALLIPTISRNPRGSEQWFSWNPKYRTDWVWRRFMINPRPTDIIQEVNFYDNPFFPAEAEEERLECLRVEPEVYPHRYLGKPDDEGQTKKLLPFVLLQACENGWEQFGIPLLEKFPHYSGLDIADTGVNRNAWANRAGPCLADLQMWRAPSLGVTTRKADRRNRDANVTRMFYDAGGGYGGGVRSHLIEIKGKPYKHTGLHFGGAVTGKKIQFNQNMTNEMAFPKRGSQLYWNLRLRAQRSREVMQGNTRINPERCLWINPEIEQFHDMLAQFSQPEWDDPQGKYIIDKAPDEVPVDAIDGCALAFGRDTEAGLIAR